MSQTAQWDTPIPPFTLTVGSQAGLYTAVCLQRDIPQRVVFRLTDGQFVPRQQLQTFGTPFFVRYQHSPGELVTLPRLFGDGLATGTLDKACAISLDQSENYGVMEDGTRVSLVEPVSVQVPGLGAGGAVLLACALIVAWLVARRWLTL